MKETKSFLKKRWQADFKAIYDLVLYELMHNGELTKINLPKTQDGLIDLRGFSTPKEYTTEKSNSGRNKTYVSEGIKIRKINFEGVDFSYSNFERCEFFDCRFAGSTFFEARFFATNHWSSKFQEITFRKTNFSSSSFQSNGILFKSIVDNFTNVDFNGVNFSEVNVHNQAFNNCQFIDCQTGRLVLDQCVFSDIVFNGDVKNIFIKRSRKVKNFDFGNSSLIGLNLHEQALDGFRFPNGNTYYRFDHKSKELARLKRDQLTDEENKLLDIIKFVWSRNKLETDFVDVNWLKNDEIETGKLIISELKKSNRN
jgi:uncharacterized protein YjbI with pentapeptide repeats